MLHMVNSALTWKVTWRHTPRLLYVNIWCLHTAIMFNILCLLIVISGVTHTIIEYHATHSFLPNSQPIALWLTLASSVALPCVLAVAGNDAARRNVLCSLLLSLHDTQWRFCHRLVTLQTCWPLVFWAPQIEMLTTLEPLLRCRLRYILLLWSNAWLFLGVKKTIRLAATLIGPKIRLLTALRPWLQRNTSLCSMLIATGLSCHTVDRNFVKSIGIRQ